MNESFDKITNQKVLFSQFECYPSENKSGWIKYIADRCKNIPLTGETTLLKNEDNNSSILLEVNIGNWDFSHFGYKIAKFNNPLIINECKIINAKDIIKQAVAYCRLQGVKLIISRVNGDNLTFIHSLEDIGFRYYETVIWPVLNLKRNRFDFPITNEVSFINADISDMDVLMHIAKKDQYKRGHFHCDEKIDRDTVNSLYAKWIKTAVESDRKIAVIKVDGQIAGYFICQIDDTFNSYYGVKFGRFQSLALDSDYRGKGIGRKLFTETIGLLKNEGCMYIDSGYSTKNHLSARLHTESGFTSVYEEATFHYWL